MKLHILPQTSFFRTLLHTKKQPLLYPTFRCPTLHYLTLRYPTLLYRTLRYPTLRYPTLRYPTLRCVTLRYGAIHYVTCFKNYRFKKKKKIICNFPMHLVIFPTGRFLIDDATKLMRDLSVSQDILYSSSCS